jgi:hypothetical protein
MVQFFKEFGNLINAGLILALGGLLIRSLLAHISVLEGRLKLADMFSAKNVTEQFDALQAQFSTINERYSHAVHALTNEAQRYAELTRTMLEATHSQRNIGAGSLAGQDGGPGSSDSSLEVSSNMCGVYRVVGQNPYSRETSYVGEVQISELGNILEAVWTIGLEPHKQSYRGVGVQLGSALAFAFPHMGAASDRPGTGVVLYSVAEPGVLRGIWAGTGSMYTGFEECRKVQG